MLQQGNRPDCSSCGLNFKKECGSTGLKPRYLYAVLVCARAEGRGRQSSMGWPILLRLTMQQCQLSGKEVNPIIAAVISSLQHLKAIRSKKLFFFLSPPSHFSFSLLASLVGFLWQVSFGLESGKVTHSHSGSLALRFFQL